MSLTYQIDSATISTTEYSLPADTTTGVPTSQTTVAMVEVWIDFANMTAAETYRVRLYEKVNAGTQRSVVDVILVGAQSNPYVIPMRFLGEGWDVTVTKVAGTDRSIAWSLRMDDRVNMNVSTISANAVTATAIASNAITAAKIAADAITSTQIADNAITANKIASAAITAAKYAADAITSTVIADNAITAGKLAANAITAAKIATDAITSSQIAANAITAAKIATDAITSTQIATGAITAAKFAADAITSTVLAANAITAAKIATDAITSTKIATDAIGSAQLAATAVTKITDGILAKVYEGTRTLQDFFRLGASVLYGKATAPTGDGSFAFRDDADTKNRVAGSLAAGARTVSTRDGT